MIERIQEYLNVNKNILDIGSGSCNVSELLSQNGYNVTPLDIQNLSFVLNIEPIIYDGKNIPFPNNSFETSLILTILHHTPDPDSIIEEAKRVSNTIIIIEDIYDNWFEKYLTFIFDSLVNFEFFGHPHTNRTDLQWREAFHTLNLEVVSVQYTRSFLVFKHATYFLRKQEENGN